MTRQQLYVYEGQTYQNFIKYVPNAVTRKNYLSRLKKYIDYCQVESIDELLYNGDIKLIQERITDFLIHIQTEGYSSATVSHCLTAVKMYYSYNDITSLNWVKMSKVLRPYRREANDRPYRTDEIAKILEKCDQRSRIIILLCCSAGVRQGAIHTMKLQDLEKIGDVYKIDVYKNESEEYYTFCSPECAKAIDDYLTYRQRCGESLKPSAPLIREQFNKDNPEAAARPRFLVAGSIVEIVYQAVCDSGIREKKNVIRNQKAPSS